MNEQLILSLSLKEALEKEDFFISPSNLHSVTLMGNIEHWSSGALLLVGPKGSGKTHLSLVWSRENNAKQIALESVIPEIERGLNYDSVCIEDLHLIEDIGIHKKPIIEEGIFHIINSIRSRGGKLLISSSKTPNTLALSLRDLVSRLQSFSNTRIREPDDSLVMALLLKYFNDRQIYIKHSILTYMATRIDRTYSAIYEFVKSLDHKSLVLNTKITRTLIDETLKEIKENA